MSRILFAEQQRKDNLKKEKKPQQLCFQVGHKSVAFVFVQLCVLGRTGGVSREGVMARTCCQATSRDLDHNNVFISGLLWMPVGRLFYLAFFRQSK